MIHDLLPKNVKIDLRSLRRVLISALIAKIFRYLLLGTFWIPFRGTIIEILLNEAVGNYSTVKTVIRALNHVTLPWLQEMNSILQYFVAHVQPLGEWHIGIGWIPVIITVSSFATYFYFFPEAGSPNWGVPGGFDPTIHVQHQVIPLQLMVPKFLTRL